MGEIRSVVGVSEASFQLPKGSTASDLISLLSSMHGEQFRARVLSPKGALYEHVRILLNGHDIRKMNGLETSLDGGDVDLIFLPIVDGG